MSAFYVDPESESHVSGVIESSLYREIHMTTKAEIVEYFRSEGGRNWRTDFTNKWIDTFGLGHDKKTKNTISRKVQGERADKIVRKGSEKGQWEKLGKALPPVKVPRKWKGKRIRITIKVTITFSDGKPVDKRFTRTLTVQQTNELVEDNNLDGVMEAYGINPDDIEEMSDVVVESIEFLD